MGPLLVIIPDRLSQLVDKGEVQPRYYNPADLFDAVHIMMTNDDQPSGASIARMVGRAQVTFHNIPEDARPILENDRQKRWRMFDAWADKAVEIARAVRPALIRCHGTDFNIVLARRIKQVLGIPYVVSLHINPDENPNRRILSDDPQQKRINLAFEDLERTCLTEADLVMPVYEPIVPYLHRLGVTRFQVCYNVLDGQNLRRKSDYACAHPARLISVGRQFAEKNPDNILRALADLPDTHLTLVGDGPIHEDLKSLTSALGLAERVAFVPAMTNAELCAALPNFDLFVVHSEYWEINKSVLEALLSGLPVIINRRIGRPVPEFRDGIVHLVDNTPDGYWQAIRNLLDDATARQALGRRAAEIAAARWSPETTEACYAGIYQTHIQRRDRP